MPAALIRLARATLDPSDGWAAAQGGTRGGADALPADVFEVRHRRELVAALADEMGDAYPELRRDKLRATEVLKHIVGAQVLKAAQDAAGPD